MQTEEEVTEDRREREWASLVDSHRRLELQAVDYRREIQRLRREAVELHREIDRLRGGQR